MKYGTIYGIGVGPGDPELITVKGAKVLAQCRHVFVPKAEAGGESLVLSIAKGYLRPDSQIHQLVFPMTSDQAELSRRWAESAREIISLLETGEDACFLTLGDPLLYSTYIYLLQELRTCVSDLRIVTIPGVTAFSAASALTEFPVGKGKELVSIVPAADDLETVKGSLKFGGTVILMKIGKHLKEILDLLEEASLIERSVFVSHAGMNNQQVETNLRNLRGKESEAGYLSIIFVHSGCGRL